MKQLLWLVDVASFKHATVDLSIVYEPTKIGRHLLVAIWLDLFHNMNYDLSFQTVIYANMSLTSSMTPIITHEKEPGAQVMHLVKQTNTGTSKKFDTKNQKVIAEIYLTRLLTTKVGFMG